MDDNLKLDPRELYFLPLGGSEQFGVNFNLYAFKKQWLAVDLGIGFADHRYPGIDILLPDPTFLEERRDDLVGMIVTHAHEDHVGAIPHLWPRLRCPVWCSPFTAQVLRKKISEYPECRDMKINVVKVGDTFKAGAFTLHAVHVAHSIPDTFALVIETKAGRVVHSGDWNLDPTPVINGPTDSETLKSFGDKGVMAYVGDSTNANVLGRSGSEFEVEQGLTALFGEIKGRIAVTMFASNVGRMRSIAKAAQAHGRHVAVAGRSLQNMSAAGRECGYLDDLPREARAALARIARGDYRGIDLGRGDTVIFSARPIPGNEAEINAVQNDLVAAGVQVVAVRDTKHIIHVSGHPCQDELSDMYQWVRPSLVVPVHGEHTHLVAQAEFARSCQIENIIVPNNGSVIQLSGKPDVVGHVETGLLAVEPRRVLPTNHPAIAERRKLQFTGAIHVTIVLDKRGDLADDIMLNSMGLIDQNSEEEMKLEDDLLDEIEDILISMEREDRYEDSLVREEVRVGVRRFVQNILNMKPKTAVHVVRV